MGVNNSDQRKFLVLKVLGPYTETKILNVDKLCYVMLYVDKRSLGACKTIKVHVLELTRTSLGSRAERAPPGGGTNFAPYLSPKFCRF